jgi:chromosome partitioning protein
MRSILVANPKGGSGKTTLATNIAVYYALRGRDVALVDYDVQASALDWLAARPENRAPIAAVDATDGRARLPRNTEVAVLDVPAGIRGRALTDVMRRAETVIIPVIPSPVDLRAAARFYEELIQLRAVVGEQVKVVTVANRVRENSPSRWLLEDYLRSLRLPDGARLPFATCLRQSQLYIRAAERGLGVFELAPSTIAHELDLWQPLLRFLNSKRSVPD